MNIKKYKISIILVGVLLIITSTGCNLSKGKNRSNSHNTHVLSEKELAYFNGNGFFNGEYMNIRNQFLTSLYDRPEDINIFELFYNGSGLEEIITEQERMDIIEYNGWEMEPDCSCTKISKTNMDKILFKYIELGLEETEKIGIENFTYLNEYDAFYYYHGDTNYLTKITFSEGTRTDNIICLYYNDDFVGDGEKVLTLKAQEGNYVFLSNKKVEK